MNKLYELKLHETLSLEDRSLIRRVPGGWIYIEFVESIVAAGEGHFLSPVFVPFNNEFKQIEAPEHNIKEDVAQGAEEYDPLTFDLEDK